MKDLKDRTVGISISSIISIASVVGILWVFIKPVIVQDIKDEIMADIAAEIVNEQRPLQTAFKEILQSGINVNRRAIAKLEYDRDHAPDSWSAERAGVLADRYLEVQAQERAYAAL